MSIETTLWRRWTTCHVDQRHGTMQSQRHGEMTVRTCPVCGAQRYVTPDDTSESAHSDATRASGPRSRHRTA